MEQYIISLFQNIGLLTAVLLGAGVLLCMVEVFVPKVALTGVLGIVLTATGVSSYYMDGFRLNQILGLLSIITLVIVVCVGVKFVLESKGIIKNPNRNKFRTCGTQNLNNLIGNFGKVITNIDLGGTIEIYGRTYYAISDTKIEIGRIVQVVGVQNNALVVKVK